jgi:hypothetical protein
MQVIFGDAEVYESRWDAGWRHKVRIFRGLLLLRACTHVAHMNVAELG